MHLSMMNDSGIVLSWRYLGWLIKTENSRLNLFIKHGIKQGEKEGKVHRVEYRLNFLDGKFGRSRIKVLVNLDKEEVADEKIIVHVPAVVNGHGPMIYKVSDVYGSVKVYGNNQRGVRGPLWDVLWRKKCDDYSDEYMEFLEVLFSVGCEEVQSWINRRAYGVWKKLGDHYVRRVNGEYLEWEKDTKQAGLSVEYATELYNQRKREEKVEDLWGMLEKI